MSEIQINMKSVWKALDKIKDPMIHAYIENALQDQAAREKWCECCTTIEEENGHGRTFYKTLYEDVGHSYYNGTVCLCHDKDGWFIHYEDNDGESMCDCKTNFCPNCGRDLRKPVNPNE